MMVTSPSRCGFCFRTYRRAVHSCFLHHALPSPNTWSHRARQAALHAAAVAEREFERLDRNLGSDWSWAYDLQARSRMALTYLDRRMRR